MNSVAVKHIIEANGFSIIGTVEGKLLYQKGEQKLLLCAPCGWVKINYKDTNEKTVRFLKLDFTDKVFNKLFQ